tara:strand:- start:3365 stop:3571 length:207 start_codon:yes stop_codon:yes gene_type:complete
MIMDRGKGENLLAKGLIKGIGVISYGKKRWNSIQTETFGGIRTEVDSIRGRVAIFHHNNRHTDLQYLQ